MYCLISVVIRQWTAVYEEAQASKRRLVDVATSTELERSPVFNAASGFLLLVDWDGGRVLGGLELPKPTGFLLEGGKLQVALWDQDEIATLAGPEIVGRLRHRWFNHLHTLERTSRGLLVTSSGTDLVAEIDERGELVWEFFLFEHGYGGKRFRLGQSFERSHNYNRRYLPAALTTHPNSAILVDEHTVLATLFTTGELVRIDRRSGQVDVVLGGLRRPHAIRRRATGGYTLADTEGGAVVLLDRNLQREGQIPVSSPWIQDAVLAGERLLVAGNRRIVMNPLAPGPKEADGDNHVIELRGGEPRKRLNFGPDSRVYMVEPIAGADAEALAHSWRGSAMDTGWLRWEVS
ncbi:hypothetical protein [Sorangium sp. So ce1151]|uniref:hypothetical protein n=1 Tax=Sorangium sp. So ce1151 TaxID=3133332 RepID=UPI003F607F69